MVKTGTKFFHTIKLGQIDKQGAVVHRSPSGLVVQFFSWIDGRPNGSKQTFDVEDANTWRFYESKAAWIEAGNKVFL
jgi:hypothetical protein